MEIRRFTLKDYDEVYQLWNRCNLHLGDSDTKEEICKFIIRNSDTSFIGVIDGEIMSCVFGGFDGRRGLVHHLAVDPQHQGKGYGAQLMDVLEKAFKDEGVLKISFWVTSDNLGVVEFYEKQGYELRDDIVTMSKII